MPELPPSSAILPTIHTATPQTPVLDAGLDELLGRLATASALFVDYLALHDSLHSLSLTIIDQLTLFHWALVTARRELQAPIAEAPKRNETIDAGIEEALDDNEILVEWKESEYETTAGDGLVHVLNEQSEQIPGESMDQTLTLLAISHYNFLLEEYRLKAEQEQRGAVAEKVLLEWWQQDDLEYSIPKFNDHQEAQDLTADIAAADLPGPLLLLEELLDKLRVAIVEFGPQARALCILKADAVIILEDTNPEDEVVEQNEICGFILEDTTPEDKASPVVKQDDTCGKKTEGEDESKIKMKLGGEYNSFRTILRKNLKSHENLQARFLGDPVLAEEIFITIAEKCHGIGELASILLQRLARALTTNGIREVLNALPSGPTDIYALLMREIEAKTPEDREFVRKLLMLLCFQIRKLRHIEMLTPLPFMPYSRIRALCGGLLGDSKKGMTLVHSSLKDYMQTYHREIFGDAHYSMAVICMDYLSLPEFMKVCTMPSSREHKYRFYNYAATAWAQHAQLILPENSRMMKKLVLKFITQYRSVASILQVTDPYNYTASTYYRRNQVYEADSSKRILTMVHFKLNDIAIPEVKKRGSKICNFKDSRGRSLLAIAAKTNNLPMVQTLLSQSDIEADMADDTDRTPFFWAATSGASEELLTLFLNRADVADYVGRDRDIQTPLMAAVRGGYLHAVKLLLANVPMFDISNSDLLGLAAYSGHVELVRLLLERLEHDVNSALERQREALELAAVSENKEAVDLRTKRAAAINARDTQGFTPLSLATQLGHLHVVKLLLAQEGIKADLAAFDGTTPLHLAAEKGYTGIVRLLLAREDVNPDSKDDVDTTPLKYACRGNHVEIVRLLLNTNKVDPNSQDRGTTTTGFTPLHIAAASQYPNILNLLLERPDIQPDLRDHRGETPLLLAAKENRICAIQALLGRKDVDPNAKGVGGYTPLIHAVSNFCNKSFLLLIARASEDLDINAEDIDGQSALFHASAHGFTKMAKSLLAQDNIQVNQIDNAGYTASGLAICYGQYEMIRLFLTHEEFEPDLPFGNERCTPLASLAEDNESADILMETIELLLETGRVNINHQNSRGRTPLMLAILNKKTRVIHRLLRCEGIDVTVRDMHGRTALTYLAEKGLLDEVKILLDPEKPWAGKVDVDECDNLQQTSLYLAANFGHTDIIEYLLEMGKAKADAKNADGTTPLIIAASRGHKKTVELLLQRDDVDRGVKDNNGDTALHCAAAAGKSDIVNLMLSYHSVDPRERNNRGRTAFAEAANGGYETVLSRLLVDRGPEFLPLISDPDSRDDEGRTPLSLAAGNGKFEVVQFLLTHKYGTLCDMNSRCNAGRTPLSYAAQYAKPWLVRFMLEQDGIDYFVTDNAGHTPRWWASPPERTAKWHLVWELFDSLKPGYP